MSPFSGIKPEPRTQKTAAQTKAGSQFDWITRNNLISALLDSVNLHHNDAMGAKLVESVIEISVNIDGYFETNTELYLQAKGKEAFSLLGQLSSAYVDDAGDTIPNCLPLTKGKLWECAIVGMLSSLVGDIFLNYAEELLCTKTLNDHEEDVLEHLLKKHLDKKGGGCASLLEKAIKRRSGNFNPVVLQGFGIAVSRFKDRSLLDSLYAREVEESTSVVMPQAERRTMGAGPRTSG